jgi:hypothetical protein
MLYVITAIPYFDRQNKRYIKIMKINNIPQRGPLSQHITHINPPRLSPFEDPNMRTSSCVYVIRSLSNPANYMEVDETPDLFAYLLENGYTINTEVTRIFQKSNIKLKDDILCYIQDDMCTPSTA